MAQVTKSTKQFKVMVDSDEDIESDKNYYTTRECKIKDIINKN